MMADADPLLIPGDRIPPFKVRSRANPAFVFDTVGGRWVALGLIGSAGAPQNASAVTAMRAADWFDDERASLFLLSADANDEQLGRLSDRIPGQRIFWDFDMAVSKLLGAIGGEKRYRPLWLVIDPSLTVRKVVPLRPDGSCAAEVLDWLRQAPPAESCMGFTPPAPILVLPDIFEPAFCDHLIGLYKAHGGEASGFMRILFRESFSASRRSFSAACRPRTVSKSTAYKAPA